METESPTDRVIKMCRHGVPSTVVEHSCGYADERDWLIPRAEAFANVQAGAEPNPFSNFHEEWAKRWNSAFHGEMDRLWRERPMLRMVGRFG